ncbi:hypothetical protein DFH09DRAFT_1338098 [Mycena vulgaris]|nr:hypothetical protein DFH09DRAFT_1338098 [Mycena vulgaris]
MTRSDVHIGDNRNFNQTLWDMDLEQLAKFGDDGPDGPATIFNLQTLIELTRQNLESDQVLDPEFAIPIRRLKLVFGTTEQATKRIISSFFMNQTFPENWFRASAPVLSSPIPAEIAAGLPQWVPGHNDANGVFVADPQPPPPFNISLGCANYWDTFGNALPSTLANVTGLFKQNVDLLTVLLAILVLALAIIVYLKHAAANDRLPITSQPEQAYEMDTAAPSQSSLSIADSENAHLDRQQSASEIESVATDNRTETRRTQGVSLLAHQ